MNLLAAFALAAIGAMAAAPVAIWLARLTSFFDTPIGYKGHRVPTPYLGGFALGAGILFPAIAFGGAAMEYSPIALCAAALWLVGTVDDRIGLHPLGRVVVEVAAAIVLFVAGLGWDVVGVAGVLGAALTVFWVVGLVNAYNLMDNMDGAASTVGCASAAGVALIAVVAGKPVLAALALSVCGACAGFLYFNLSSPARIFLGDGGSMPLGFLIAAMTMAVPLDGGLGILGIVALAPVAGLPILDTCLVVVSRRRRGVAVMRGGRDHLTHRLRNRLSSARAVAMILAAAQAALCGVAVALTRLDAGEVAAGAMACLTCGVIAIWTLERPAFGPLWTPAPVEAPVVALAPAEDPPVLVAAAQEQSA